MLVEACGLLAGRGVAVRGADRRPGRQARRRGPRADRRARAGADVRAARPDGPGRAARRVPPRRARSACRAGVSTNDRDGIPNVLVEAMAGGVPVVTTAVSGIPELVADEVNGLLVPPERPGGARRRPVAAARGPRARRAAGTAGRHTVRERFDGDRARPAAGRRCSRRRRADRADRVAPQPGVLRDRARAPRPRRRRGGRRRALHATPARRRELGTEPDWLGRRPARRRGVADRVDQVLLRARPRPRLRDHRRARFLAAWERLVGSCLAPGPGRPRRRATSPPAGCTTGSTPGRASASSGLDGLADGCAERSPPQAAPRPREADPRAQPPHARAVRAADRRARAAVARRRGCCASRSPSSTATSPQDFRADGVHRESSTHYHLIALRSFVGARENAAPLRHRAARRVRRPPRAACDFARPLPPARRHDPGALRRRQRRLLASCSSCAGVDARAEGTRRRLPRRRLLHAAQRLGTPTTRS